MPWQQVVMNIASSEADRVEAALVEAGAVAVTFTNAGVTPVLEPAPGETPLWDRLQVTALFAESVDTDSAIRRAADRLGSGTLPGHGVELLEDKEWEREWRLDFRPTRFGKRLWVCPRGQTSGRDAAIELALDPGLAFGTGSHETTAMCLEWLDQKITGPLSVLDYGCGSGILAIAGLLLGSAQATATDIDPQALVATRANAEANGVIDRLRIAPVDTLPVKKHDLVIANILAGTLMDLAPKLAQLTDAGGLIGLSGILSDQAMEVRSIYSQWFEIAKPVHRGDWSFLEGKRL